MEANKSMDQVSKEIHNHLNNVIATTDLGRSEAQWRLAERKMTSIEGQLLSDPYVTEEQIASLVTFKRGSLWKQAEAHVANLAA